jgi:2-polyprenyl-3-methyl-5-hydroxy-6-metoxy-1,4-benzoquinol methylase
VVSDGSTEGPERKGDLSSIYEVPVDPFAENNSHAFALSLVGYNKSVLEVGCSTGYLTKIMAERGCEVIGIELDPDAAEIAEKWAERVVVGNIDEGQVWDEVKDESFDVVLLGDVLEHLRDPLTSLRQAVKKLKPSGYVVTSIPNIAHGDVRLTLLQGSFTYQETGLLDRTHIHFFTLGTARELMTQAGLVVVNTKRVVMPLFGSELEVNREGVSHATLDQLHADPEVESYQFVMKAVRDSGDFAVAELANQVAELTDRVHHQRMRIALLRKGIRDNNVLAGHLRAHQRHIEALEGHVSGLEHNIELFNKELQAADARYRAALAMTTKPSLTRRLYHKLVRTIKPNALGSHG